MWLDREQWGRLEWCIRHRVSKYLIFSDLGVNEDKTAGLFNTRPKLTLLLDLNYIAHRPIKMNDVL